MPISSVPPTTTTAHSLAHFFFFCYLGHQFTLGNSLFYISSFYLFAHTLPFIHLFKCELRCCECNFLFFAHDTFYQHYSSLASLYQTFPWLSKLWNSHSTTTWLDWLEAPCRRSVHDATVVECSRKQSCYLRDLFILSMCKDRRWVWSGKV